MDVCEMNALLKRIEDLECLLTIAQSEKIILAEELGTAKNEITGLYDIIDCALVSDEGVKTIQKDMQAIMKENDELKKENQLLNIAKRKDCWSVIVRKK
uniref:HAP1 N-terminal domain-containing protein n=1 Tax=Rhabditophanes sp. KR3021 TaxID=114890 RepID=A0AC35TQB9_9BILA